VLDLTTPSHPEPHRPTDTAHAQRPAPSINVFDDYGWLRGFSVVPSWGARIETAWAKYDGAAMRREIAPAKLFHANCIRLWIEYTAWLEDPEGVTANFLDAVDAIDEAGMKVMPCLFNRWHDTQADYGGTYIENILHQLRTAQGDREIGNRIHHRRYLKALVEPLKDDPRVLMWDLCNEPGHTSALAAIRPGAIGVGPELEQLEVEWLEVMADTVRGLGARQPITIGTMARLPQIEAFAHICDVLCGHPYTRNRDELVAMIAGYKELAARHGKPFHVNETIPGGADDKARGELAAMYDELLSEAGFGWLGWALSEGLAVSTRRDLSDANGIDEFGYHPFVTRGGHPRGGLEALMKPPRRRAPWLD
jgi:hypothetical protein